MTKKECTFINIDLGDGLDELSFRGAEDVNSKYNNVKKEDKVVDDTGCGDEGCLVPLLDQVRGLMKGAKQSWGSLMSGGGDRKIFERWRSICSFSRSCDAGSTEGEPLCLTKTSEVEPLYQTKTSEGEPLCQTKTSECEPICPTKATWSTTLARSVSMPTPVASKMTPFQARDPQARAEALPLAHYRPTDGVIASTVKEEDLKVAACSPGHVNCKKPPKPPRHPGRSTSIDTALRNARKNRDRASAKRKSRTAAAASATTGVTPLVAMVLTVGFGLVMVFQGVFVQTNASYGKNVGRSFVDVANLRTSSLVVVDKAVPFQGSHLRSSIRDVSKSEEVVKTFHKSMEDLPWGQSSLPTRVRSLQR